MNVRGSVASEVARWRGRPASVSDVLNGFQMVDTGSSVGAGDEITGSSPLTSRWMALVFPVIRSPMKFTRILKTATRKCHVVA